MPAYAARACVCCDFPLPHPRCGDDDVNRSRFLFPLSPGNFGSGCRTKPGRNYTHHACFMCTVFFSSRRRAFMCNACPLCGPVALWPERSEFHLVFIKRPQTIYSTEAPTVCLCFVLFRSMQHMVVKSCAQKSSVCENVQSRDPNTHTHDLLCSVGSSVWRVGCEAIRSAGSSASGRV